jgi:nicotinamidase-related amidase
MSIPLPIDPKKMALIVIDMWDKHWCDGATDRIGVLAPKVNDLVNSARDCGVLIIHAPSDCIDFYKDSLARKRFLQEAPPQLPKNQSPPVKVVLTFPQENGKPKIPIDDSDGGCDTGQTYRGSQDHVWHRQHNKIQIVQEADFICDGGEGQRVFLLLAKRGIRTPLYAGVHLNMCVLYTRRTSMIWMRQWGMNCVLIRDLTDSAYNPKRPPFVSHEQGTEKVIKFIQQYGFATTILSGELKSALQHKFN